VLHAACEKSDVKLVQKLLEYDQAKEVVLAQNESGDSIMFCCYSDVDVLNFLIDTNPALLDMTNQQGMEWGIFFNQVYFIQGLFLVCFLVLLPALVFVFRRVFFLS
jgi:hypothetical protein